MGRRKGAKKNAAAAGEAGEQPAPASEFAPPADPPRAALAVHPQGGALAVAVGPELRVYCAKSKQHKVLVSKAERTVQAQQQGQAAGPACLRGVAFDPTGRLLLAGSEDKAAGMRMWDCATWQLQQSIKVHKKATAVTFTADGRHALAADKFGDVLAAVAERPAGLPKGQQQEPEIMLGHYCSILTSLSLSAGGRLLATTDRDNRLRVSVVPADPLAGAHEIQSCCFGHDAFVSCSAFVQQGGQELLVSGGGDGTLRLWDPLTGTLLHTLQLPALLQQADAAQSGQEQQGAAAEGREQEDGGSSGSDDEAAGEDGEAAAPAADTVASDATVPLALAASPDGSWVVAALDGQDELLLLQMDWAAKQLRECGRYALAGLHLPACLTFDASGRLWAAGGPVADDSTAAFLACGSVAPAAAGKAGEQQQGGAALVDAPLPDWLPADAVRQLEGKTGDEEDRLAAASERRRLASQQLRKRKYTEQELEERKKRRRDKVAAAAAAAAAAVQ